MSRARDVSDVLSGLGSNIVLDAGVGVDFDGGVLDDYEEGTWTPDFETGTAEIKIGHYVKVGTLVFVYGRIRNPSVRSSSTNTVRIINLPFTPVNAIAQSFRQHPLGTISVRRIAKVSGYGSWKNCAVNSASEILLWAEPDGSSEPIAMIHSRFTDAFSSISFSLVYEAA